MIKILIDNGHGQNTPGKCSPDKSLLEWKYTREIAIKVVDKLKELGYDSDVITYDLNNDPRRHLKFVDTHIKVKKVLYETKFTDIKPTDYDGFVVGSDQI